MADDSLARAIGLVKAGKVDVAREQLELILKEDRNNILAWHWYAQTWPGAKEKIRIWQACLRYNPGNERAQQALKDLNFEPQKPITPEVKRQAPPTPARSATNTGSSLWLLWISIGLLAVVAVVAWVVIVIKKTVPVDPQQYKHAQPVEYYLYVPKTYSADKEWPLFVGIHGSGGNGLQCWQLFQAYAEKEGFILLCPSIPGTSDGYYQDVGERTVWSAIGEVQKSYRVRPQMFFSGFSAGAFFIQGFNYHYPQSVSGLSILSSTYYLDARMFPVFIPMLVVIGDQDSSFAVEGSRVFVNDLQRDRFDVQYKVMPGVGHTVTQEGVDLTMNLFRKTIGK